MDNLKDCWCRARFRTSSNHDSDNRRKTALATLAAHYQNFSTISFVMALCLPLCLWNVMKLDDGSNIRFKFGLVLFGMLYFLTASMMDRWLYKGISRIDVAIMSVSEVCNLAFYYRKKHLQFIGILLPMAIGFIGTMIWMLSGNIGFIYGAAAGAAIGGALGVRQLMVFMKEYRDITN